LGCGYEPRKSTDEIEWVNIDLNPEVSFPDKIMDIQKPLPYEDSSIDGILIIHVIEHVSHQKIMDMFKDWYRILKPGGKVDIECPNFTEAIKKWLIAPDWGDGSTYHTIFGGQRDVGSFHIAGYSYEILDKLLKEAGFAKVEKGGTNYEGSENAPPSKGLEYGRDWNIRVIAYKQT